MTRKRKEFPILENTITDVAAEGKALARGGRHGGFRSLCRSRRCGRPENPEEKTSLLRSDSRKVPPISSSGRTFCPHFGVCGGCKWQCLPYKEQLKYKATAKFWIILPVSVR